MFVDVGTKNLNPCPIVEWREPGFKEPTPLRLLKEDVQPEMPPSLDGVSMPVDVGTDREPQQVEVNLNRPGKLQEKFLLVARSLSSWLPF
jgi:hypothetical protein